MIRIKPRFADGGWWKGRDLEHCPVNTFRLVRNTLRSLFKLAGKYEIEPPNWRFLSLEQPQVSLEVPSKPPALRPGPRGWKGVNLTTKPHLCQLYAIRRTYELRKAALSRSRRKVETPQLCRIVKITDVWVQCLNAETQSSVEISRAGLLFFAPYKRFAEYCNVGACLAPQGVGSELINSKC